MSFAYKISAYNRKRKWDLFLSKISPDKNISVLDVGFNAREYSDTDNYIEKNYPYPERLTALGLSVSEEFKSKYPDIKAVRYDGNVFPFKNNDFDICWSNAVIEHVGNRERQVFFLKEIKRVSRRAFISTPNRLFPIEVHTRTPLLHYLPDYIFNRYLSLTGKGWAAGNYMNLLSFKEVTTILHRAGITKYRIFKNRIAGFSMDFVIMFE